MRARPRRLADRPGADRGVGARLGRVRARGDARPRRQRRDRLLDREPRPDGRPHRRQRLRRAAADAHRQALPAAARPGDRGDPRDRRRDRRLERAVRRQPGDRRDRRDRDEPARLALESALASKATGFPIAKIAARLAVGYTLQEIPNDITRATPASFEPAIDYCVVKWPRFAFEKFPGAEPGLTTHMKSVGEAMAIGRTFKQAFAKALRSRELDSRRHATGRRGGAARGARAAGGPERFDHLLEALRRGLRRRELQRAHSDRPVVPARAARAGAGSGGRRSPASGRSSRSTPARPSSPRARPTSTRRWERPRVGGRRVPCRGLRGRARRAPERRDPRLRARTASARGSSSTTAACTPRRRCASPAATR